MTTLEVIKRVEELGFMLVENTPESANVRIELWKTAMVVHSICMIGIPNSDMLRVSFENRLENLQKEIIKHGGQKRNELLSLLSDIKILLFDF